MTFTHVGGTPCCAVRVTLLAGAGSVTRPVRQALVRRCHAAAVCNIVQGPGEDSRTPTTETSSQPLPGGAARLPGEPAVAALTVTTVHGRTRTPSGLPPAPQQTPPNDQTDS
ncbi:hypothetical protein GCM10010121_037700 [Streptomyces brasiliensis]|uniref:Uncharacterized protein n=1 Tax=Streptomyces brasiliensis TaxID=1954 RepID=A0A917KRL0_9ACTN|nr:hypothetical protein GCM10010121_037700 [Streptomyces brasiliensis]